MLGSERGAGLAGGTSAAVERCHTPPAGQSAVRLAVCIRRTRGSTLQGLDVAWPLGSLTRGRVVSR
eukprot:2414875-Rhodomonas_salina.2